MKKVFLIVGASGTGKDTIVNYLCEQHNLKRVKSYTTRPSRGTETDETSHEFVTDEQFDALTDIVAYTEFNGYRYCATKDQVDKADLYIIDPEGIKYMKEKYDGEREIFVIRLISTKADRFLRMLERGDDTQDALERVRNDDKAFDEKVFAGLVDEVVVNSPMQTIEEVAEEVYDIIKEEGE